MKALWRIPEFLDLEYFFIRDKELAEVEGDGALRDRDRRLYLEQIAPDIDVGVSPPREWLIRRWLQERRTHEDGLQGGRALLPGRMWYELYGLLWTFFSFLALLSGAGLTWSFLRYSGGRPVNVSLFILVFVAGQLSVLLLLLVTLLYRRISGLDLRSSLLLSLVNKGLISLHSRIKKFGLGSVGTRRRAQIAAALAVVHGRGQGYGALFFWPLFLLFQLFGVAFNCGVLGVFLLKVASSDLAFGWQSTLQVSPQFVANLVRLVALPWSWFLGTASYPDLAQIEGSRMILKDGFYHLVSSDLVSWWPFLCLAVACYCLLPRVVLFMVGTLWRNAAQARISLRRPDHNQLMHRLLAPRLETCSPSLAREESRRNWAAPPPRTVAKRGEGALARGVEGETFPCINGELLALVPAELYGDCDRVRLDLLCRNAFGYSIGEMLRINDAYDVQSLASAVSGKPRGLCGPILIVQEAWQPPIQEMMRFLRQLRACADSESSIIVALLGKPSREGIFTQTSEADLGMWQRGMGTLHDPCLVSRPLLGG